MSLSIRLLSTQVVLKAMRVCHVIIFLRISSGVLKEVPGRSKKFYRRRVEVQGVQIFSNQNIPSLAATNDSYIADMNYYLYKQDIARLAATGAPYNSLHSRIKNNTNPF